MWWKRAWGKRVRDWKELAAFWKQNAAAWERRSNEERERASHPGCRMAAASTTSPARVHLSEYASLVGDLVAAADAVYVTPKCRNVDDELILAIMQKVDALKVRMREDGIR